MAIARLCGAALALMFATFGISQTAKTAGDISGYKLIDLQVSGATSFPREKLMAQFPIKVGDKADMARINRGLDRIRRLFAESGYLDFKIIPWIDVDRESKTVSCSFELVQGMQYVVRRLDLVGRHSFPAVAVESELSKLGLEEGKVFRLSLLDEAVKTLNKLLGSERLTSNSYEFKKLSDTPGAVDVTVRLQEEEAGRPREPR